MSKLIEMLRIETCSIGYLIRQKSEWIGLERIGLERKGLDWTGLDWTGLDWKGMDWKELIQN